jgi:SAM-dependent methyltransferase
MIMSSNGPAFYDDDLIFATYTEHRQQLDNPPDTLEKPVFLDLVGAVVGQRILDLGCGAALFGREALEQGAKSYTGVEGARTMVALAEKTLAGSTGQVKYTAIEAWNYPEAAFDLVISRLALHYIEDFAALCANVYQTLASNGRFIFSVEHPVITACAHSWQTNGSQSGWMVDTYFVPGPRITAWLGGEVVRYHRTMEDYFASLQSAGFVVERLRESCPRREQFADAETYEQRKRVPLFLFLAARKL